MTLDPDICYRALESRDDRFDGRFFTGVLTTGVYCRPVCPARTPQRKNVRFFSCAAAAEEAGFRPCMRCRPETSPGTPAWMGTSTTVSRALRMIDEGFLDEAGVDDLAERLGIGARHLRRLFDEHLGASPIAIAQSRRVHFAKRLLECTSLPVTDIAFSAGFASVRRFNTAFKNTFARTPSDVRRSGGSGVGVSGDGAAGTLSLELTYRRPYAWHDALDFLGARAMAGVESVGAGAYRRAVSFGDDAGVIAVTHRPERSCLVLHIPTALYAHAHAIAGRVRRMFDLKAEPRVIDQALAADPLLRAAVARYPGTRVPGPWDPFETAVRVIIGQQVSVKAATTVAGRLVKRYGTAVIDDMRTATPRTRSGDRGSAPARNARASEPPRPGYVFPRPGKLRRARLDTVGLTRARASAIRRVAAAVDDGAVALDGSADLDAVVAQLLALDGIGPWTAQCIAMRACAEPDAFPLGDLGLRRGAASLDARLENDRALAERAEQWRPWRAYATRLLWKTLSDVERSES